MIAAPWIALLFASPQVAQAPERAPAVARIELEAPRVSPFLLRAVVPVPAGTWPESGQGTTEHGGFALRLAGTEPIPAQVEVVARRPNGDPDALEVCACVELPKRVRPGARMDASLVRTERDEADAPFAREAAIAELLRPAAAGGPWLRARDVHGNLYAAELCGRAEGHGFGAARVLKDGRWQRVTRLAVTLMPVARPDAQPAPTGPPLPHLLAVHAYLHEHAGENALGLDLRVHNGSIAPDPRPDEVPLGIVYWTNLELLVPQGWEVASEVEDPFLGDARDEGRWRVVPLVKPLPDGKLHVMGPQAQFERRLALVRRGEEARAEALLRFAGVGFAARGRAPAGQGRETWSWFESETASYFPQREVLARLDFARDGELTGTAAVRSRFDRELSNVRAALASGTPHGAYYVVSNVMGWAHPWFVPEQGGVGGEGIALVEGHDVAWAASREGLELLALRHRMNVSRQPEATYDRAGEVVGYHRWLGADGKIPFDYRMHGRVAIPAFRLPCRGGPPASEQVREVVRRELRPSYDQGTAYEKDGEEPGGAAILGWWPHDDQHLIRYTKQPKALAWLANDPLAKDDLLLTAQLFRLFVHESPHAPETWSAGLTLAIWEQIAAAHPHTGLPLGREHAWGIDAMCAAYSLADPTWRERERPWFARMTDLMLAGAQPSGLIQRQLNHRLLDGSNKYTVAQTFECLFLVHAQRAICESVWRGVDDARRAALEGLALRAVDYLYFGPAWARHPSSWQPDPANPTYFLQGPRAAIAVSPNDDWKTPPFSDAERWGANYLPPDGLGGGVEITYPWHALDWAARLTDGEEAGKGASNRYRRRLLECANPCASWEERLAGFARELTGEAADNSSSWVGLLGSEQNGWR